MEYRNSSMEMNQVYFFTATINQWKHLLTDSFKNIIISSLQFLTSKKLIEVYGYVIMPNHVHLLWRMNCMNGKEKPNASFLKFTAHQFKKNIDQSVYKIDDFKVNADNKQFEFWQRDSLAIPVYNRLVAEQKLTYIHGNPLQEHWALSPSADEYLYSSSAFYNGSPDSFNFLTHYMEIL